MGYMSVKMRPSPGRREFEGVSFGGGMRPRSHPLGAFEIGKLAARNATGHAPKQASHFLSS